MASIPGLPADVHYGDAEKSLPDWRAEAQEDEGLDPAHDDPDDSEDHRQAVAAILGFDPLTEDDNGEAEGG